MGGVKNAEARVVVIEDELAAIGENQKALEVSEEKARRREEKYQDQIKQIQIRLKQSDSRSEYAEMNISKLHLRIDELEDEIIREKLKINAVSGQLDETQKYPRSGHIAHARNFAVHSTFLFKPACKR